MSPKVGVIVVVPQPQLVRCPRKYKHSASHIRVHLLPAPHLAHQRLPLCRLNPSSTILPSFTWRLLPHRGHFQPRVLSAWLLANFLIVHRLL